MKLSILAFLTLFSILATSQDLILSYEDALNIAVEKNILLQQQKNQLKLASAQHIQSYANYLPDLNIVSSGSRTTGRQFSDARGEIIDGEQDVFDYNINSTMLVFNGFRNYYQLKQTSQLFNAQKNQVEQSIQDVIFQTSVQFLQILLNKELMKVAEEDIVIQKRLYEQIEILVNAGTRTHTELLTQEAQLRSSEANGIDIRNQYLTAKTNLAKTLLFEPGKEFEILYPEWNVEDVLLQDYNLDTLFNIAIKNNYDLKRLKYQEEAAHNGVRISKTALMPSVSIFYNYRSYYLSGLVDSDSALIPFEDQILRNEIYWNRFGFNINIPIFNRLQNRTAVVQSKINYENSKLTSIDAELQLYLDLQSAYQDFVSYKESYIANKTNALAAKKSYERQNELYRLGQGNLTDLNLENQQFIQAESGKIQAEYTLLFQQIILDYYLSTLELSSK